VLEIFYLGITTGTTPATYDPAANVTRLQMAAFLSRTVDGVVHRTSRRTILNQLWTQHNTTNPVAIGGNSLLAQSDGTDVWVTSRDNGLIRRIRATDGYDLGAWTGAAGASGVVIFGGTVWVTGFLSPPEGSMVFRLSRVQRP
jgi:hypothetical protein